MKSLYIFHKEVYGSPTPLSCWLRINLHSWSKKEFWIDDIVSTIHICLNSKYASNSHQFITPTYKDMKKI